MPDDLAPVRMNAHGRTVEGVVAERVVDMIRDGASMAAARREVCKFGLSLSRAMREEIARLLSENSVEEEIQAAMVRAQLTRLLTSQDPDIVLKAIKEAKGILGMDKPVQVDLQVRRPAGADEIEAAARRE